MTTKKSCHTAADIPAGPHYAIITNTSVQVAGGVRERPYRKPFIEYVAFTNYDEWMEEITRLTDQAQVHGTPIITAIQVTPTTVGVKNQAGVPASRVYTPRCPHCGQIAHELLRDMFATRVCLCGHKWKPAEDLQE